MNRIPIDVSISVCEIAVAEAPIGQLFARLFDAYTDVSSGFIEPREQQRHVPDGGSNARQRLPEDTVRVHLRPAARTDEFVRRVVYLCQMACHPLGMIEKTEFRPPTFDP